MKYPTIEDPHCYCCGRTEFEVLENRTSCCRDQVCDGSEVIIYEVGNKQQRWVGKVEACCPAVTYVMARWAGLHRDPVDELDATCSYHNSFSPESYALILQADESRK